MESSVQHDEGDNHNTHEWSVLMHSDLVSVVNIPVHVSSLTSIAAFLPRGSSECSTMYTSGATVVNSAGPEPLNFASIMELLCQPFLSST